MIHPHALNTPLPDLLRAGGASQQAIDNLTPAAAQATKGTLLHLWLRTDNFAHQHFGGGQAAGQLPDSAGLTQQDINSITVAFENAYASSAGIGAATAPSGFFCFWSCCCCCYACCCAAAVEAPAVV